MSVPSLTIIIPVYNEEKRLRISFNEIDAYVQEYPHMDVSFVFVDDGSTDATRSLLEQYSANRSHISVLGYEVNQGKGSAVRKGMLETKGEYKLMVDADMSTSLSEISKIIPYMKQGIPIIVGTRKEHGAKLLKKQPWYRQGMGDIYGIVARLVTGVKIKDFGCGFKAFSDDAAQRIFKHTIINRWTFDTEVLFLARKNNIAYKEVGVNWKNDEDTRVDVVRDAIQSLYDVIRMYIHHTR